MRIFILLLLENGMLFEASKRMPIHIHTHTPQHDSHDVNCKTLNNKALIWMITFLTHHGHFCLVILHLLLQGYLAE